MWTLSSSFKKFMRRLFLWLAVIFIVLAILHSVANIIIARQLNNTIQTLKAQGKLKTIEELKPPHVPDDENAALLYEKAFVLMTEGKGGVKYISGKDGARANDKIEALKSLINTMLNEPEHLTTKQKEEIVKAIHSPDIKKVLSFVEEAVKKPECMFNIPYSKGYKALTGVFSPTALFGGIVRILSAKALVEAENGNVEEALRAIHSGLKVLNHQKKEPILITQLVRLVGDNTMTETLNKVIQTKELPPQSAQLLLDELYKHEEMPWMLNAMDMEIAIGSSIFEEYMQNRIDLSSPSMRRIIGNNSIEHIALLLYTSFPGRPLFKKDMMTYLTLMTKMREVIAKPPYDNAVQNLEKNSIYREIPSYCIFSLMTIPRLAFFSKLIAHHQSNVQLARIALVLKLYKTKYNNYPSALDELVPEFLNIVPHDPFSGKSFVYKKSGNGFLLYSLGYNMKDDNGKPADFSSGTDAGDIVWKSEN